MVKVVKVEKSERELNRDRRGRNLFTMVSSPRQ